MKWGSLLLGTFFLVCFTFRLLDFRFPCFGPLDQLKAVEAFQIKLRSKYVHMYTGAYIHMYVSRTIPKGQQKPVCV
jgi:hypothetical protein